jgi:hypothetical protein
MRFLRQNTAIRLTVGPFYDKTDKITPEVALTVTSEKLTFVVDNGNVPTLILNTSPTASGGSNDMIHISSDVAGLYDLELTAANTNYLGRAILSINDVLTHCPVFHEFTILPAKVYDSLFLGSDNLEVDAVQLLGTAWATPGTAGTPDVNVLALSTAAILAIWHQALAQISTASTIGKLIKDYLDAAISSRSTFAGGAVASVTAGVTLAADQAVNATKIGGTIQTGRDLGASVLISPGIGTGQLDVTSGVIKANLAQILGTALTETAGYLAAGFKKVFNVATPVFTAASVNQTGDSYSREGAPAGASLAADIAAIQAKTVNLPASPAAVGSKMDIVDSPSATGVAVIVSATWDKLLTGITTSGSIGKLIRDYLDAAMTTRAPASSALSSVTWTNGRAALLDFLDALISSRLATASYTLPPSAAAIADQIDAQLSANHGAGAWVARVVGSITYPDPAEPFLDPNGNPLEGVIIEAYSDSDRTTLVDALVTDVNGNFTFHLNAGEYFFRAILSRYENYEWSKELE